MREIFKLGFKNQPKLKKKKERERLLKPNDQKNVLMRQIKFQKQKTYWLKL